MADKLMRKGVVLAKVETTAGTDAVPTATNVVLTSVPQHGVSGNKQVRDYMRDTLSPTGFTVGAKKQTISFSCEFKGPNSVPTPDTATYLDALLQACGLVGASGIYTGSDNGMLYKPTSTIASMKAISIYYFMDGMKHALVGCRGNAVFEFAVDTAPKVTFTFTGTYVDPTDTSNPTGLTLQTFEPPVAVNLGLTLASYTPTGVERLTLDLGNKITEKKDVNSTTGLSCLVITGREPKFSMDCDVDTLANFNPYTIWKAGTLQAISWSAGVKGNRVGILLPTARMDEPAKAEKDGRAVYNLSFTPTGTDDEYTIKTG